MKRVIDIFGAVVGIIIFLPIKFVTAIHIKRVSPEGPIFADIPNRAGQFGKDFRMYKFRSMIPNAHEWFEKNPELYEKYKANDYKLEADEDPRLIPGAVFMRKSSIDELPQFFNILFGHMSLVGPRAYYPFEIEEQVEKFPETKKHIEILSTAKPGLTGPWQVGGRNEIDFVSRVKMDAVYAGKQSIVYDLKILLKTPFIVIFGKGVI